MKSCFVVSDSLVMVIAASSLLLLLGNDNSNSNNNRGLLLGCHAFQATTSIGMKKVQKNNFLLLSCDDENDCSGSSSNSNGFQLLHKAGTGGTITDEDGSATTDRRSFVTNAVLGTATAALFSSFSSPQEANAIVEEENEVFYFGCGCFWHVQHEFVEAERKLLGRSDSEITARAGYAGGKTVADGKVCYHNAAMIGDYGKLGHAEIVSVSIPKSRYREFATEYCKLFTKGLRPDQDGDRGLEYRNIVGLPGGAKRKDGLANELIEASKATGDELDFAIGKGGDKDLRKVVWIMDTNDYPTYKAEQYHQFHDGFNFNENYPAKYNNLVKQNFVNEDFGKCPNGGLGLGIGGL